MLNERAKKLVAALPPGFEAGLVGTEVNRFYLLDFDAGDAGTLLLLPDKLIYIIDSRYIESARREVKTAEVVLEDDALVQLAELLRAEGTKTLHLDSGASMAWRNRLKEKIPFVDYDETNTLSSAFMALREIKDAEELSRIEAAQQVTDACFAHILPFIKEGVAELDLALEMETFMRRGSGGPVAFPTICVGGKNSSLPHGEPGTYRLQKGDLLTMDFGATYKGYCSDMTRTVALGTPDDEKRKVYDTVLRAHLAGIKAAAAGKTGAAVDKVARDIIDEAGYTGAFGHGLGHAVGTEIHEDPRFSPRCQTVIRAGMVMTVEPGIYLAGRFGCRIEDTVVITETGCRPLPTSPKELMVL